MMKRHLHELRWSRKSHRCSSSLQSIVWPRKATDFFVDQFSLEGLFSTRRHCSCLEDACSTVDRENRSKRKWVSFERIEYDKRLFLCRKLNWRRLWIAADERTTIAPYRWERVQMFCGEDLEWVERIVRSVDRSKRLLKKTNRIILSRNKFENKIEEFHKHCRWSVSIQPDSTSTSVEPNFRTRKHDQRVTILTAWSLPVKSSWEQLHRHSD